MKSPIESKTVWFNLIGLAAIILTNVMAWDWVQSNHTAMTVLGSAYAIVNIALRFMTTQPITPPKDGE